jgi:hypothetical protein
MVRGGAPTLPLGFLLAGPRPRSSLDTVVECWLQLRLLRRRRVNMRFGLMVLSALLLAVLIGAKHAEAAGLF